MDIVSVVQTVAGIVAGTVAGAIAGAKASGGAAPPPSSSTILPPPPPQPSHPSLSGACEHDGEIDSLRRDHEALKGEVRAEAARATDFRERVLERLARIGERLKITQERGHGDRGST